MEEHLEKCKSCKSELRRNIRRCPYCGVLNPTVKLPEIFMTTAIIIAVMYILTLIFT